MQIQLSELIELVQSKNPEKTHKDIGQHICVLDRGFVYVGDVTDLGDRLVIKRSKNIRKWGTTRGLGELVNGPLSATVMDDCGDVMVFKTTVLHLIACRNF